MNNSPIFENERFESITDFIEQKIPLLKENKDFTNKYNKLYEIIDKLRVNMNEVENELLDQLIDLNYEVDKYYFILAYSLGAKYGEELGKI